MSNPPNMAVRSEENFLEAAQLIDSHRKPVALMFIVLIAVLGSLSIWLTGLSTGAQVAMSVMLVGFLWYGNSFWLVSFCLVVFTGQVVGIGGRHFTFSSGLHLAECILMLLIIISGFRYVELRTYEHAFSLNDSHRRMKLASGHKQTPWFIVVFSQIFRRQWYHSVIAMVLAFGLLWRFPASNYWRNEYWMQPVAARFILLSLILFFIWFVCRAVISIWDWFLLTPRQADVAFRSWANRELWRDMAGVEKRRERLRMEQED